MLKLIYATTPSATKFNKIFREMREAHPCGKFTVMLPGIWQENGEITCLGENRAAIAGYCSGKKGIKSYLFPMVCQGSQEVIESRTPEMKKKAQELQNRVKLPGHHLIIPIIRLQGHKDDTACIITMGSGIDMFYLELDAKLSSHEMNWYEQAKDEIYTIKGTIDYFMERLETYGSLAENKDIKGFIKHWKSMDTNKKKAKTGSDNTTEKTTYYGTVCVISSLLACGSAFLANKFEQWNSTQVLALILAVWLIPNLLYAAYENSPGMCAQRA